MGKHKDEVGRLRVVVADWMEKYDEIYGQLIRERDIVRSLSRSLDNKQTEINRLNKLLKKENNNESIHSKNS